MMRLCTQTIQNDEVMYSNYTKWWGYVLKLYKMMRLCTQAHTKCMRLMYINLIQNVWGYVLHNYTKWWGYVLKLYKMMRLCTQTHTKCMRLMYIKLIQNVWGYVLHNYTKWWGYVLKLYKMMRLSTQIIQNDEIMYSSYTKWWGYVLKLIQNVWAWCTSTSYDFVWGLMYINLIQNVWGWCTSNSYKMYELDVHQTHTKCMRLMYIKLYKMMRLCTQTVQNDEVMYSNSSKCMRLMYIKLYKMMRLCTQAIQNDEVMYSISYKMYEIDVHQPHTKCMRLDVLITIQNDEVMYSKYTKWCRLCTQTIQNVRGWCISNSYKMYEIDVHQPRTKCMSLMYLNSYKMYEVDVHQTHTKCMSLMYIKLIRFCMRLCTT